MRPVPTLADPRQISSACGRYRRVIGARMGLSSECSSLPGGTVAMVVQVHV